MPTSYAPLQAIELPEGNTTIFTAVAFSMLLPVFKDEDAFSDVFSCLFGENKMMAKLLTLSREMGNILQTPFPPSLSLLINEHLCPRFDAHCQQYNLPNRTAEDVINALSNMINMPIHMHVAGQRVTNVAQQSLEQGIHLFMCNGNYQPLINPAILSPELSAHFFPVHNQTVLEQQPPASFKCPAFEGMLRHRFTESSRQLAGLSKAKPEPNITNIITEPTALIPTPYPGDLTVLHPLELRVTNVENEVKAFEAKLQDGRVNLYPGRVERLEAWDNQILPSAGIGFFIGETIMCVGEFGVAGWSLSVSSALLSLPLPILLLILGVGRAVGGGYYAQEFSKALAAATGHLDRNNPSFQDYDNAAGELDKILGKWGLEGIIQSTYLTYDHYAAAHFFRAICAQKIGTLPLAYHHFTQAGKFAKDTKNVLIPFLCKLHRQHILRIAQPGQLIGVDTAKELDNTLFELVKLNEMAFLDIYCKIHDNIRNFTLRFLQNNNPLSLGEIANANAFLLFDGFYMLKHFSNGRGEFLEIFSLFYQGAMLAYFSHENPEYLMDATRNILSNIPADVNQDEELVLLKLASTKMTQSLERLVTFKNNLNTVIKNDPELESAIKSMESFMIDFYAHCANKKDNKIVRYFNPIYPVVAKKLAISDVEANLLLETTRISIEWLTVLERDFKLRYLSVEAWLDDIVNQKDVTSNTTGDTMLHLVTRFPATTPELSEKIKGVAGKLKELRYVRNRNHETPLFALIHDDSNELNNVICPEPMIEIGHELNELKSFLDGAAKNINSKNRFLILKGPMGTGKASSVLKHAYLQLDYKLKEWTVDMTSSNPNVLKDMIDLFNETKNNAKSFGTLHMIFINNIDNVICKDDTLIQFFLGQIGALVHHHVVVIGATNNFDNLDSRIKQIVGQNHIQFKLPDNHQRLKLLEHFFRQQQIQQVDINKLAKKSSCYSPRQLCTFVEELLNKNKSFIDSEVLVDSFNIAAEKIGQGITDKTSCAKVFMPSYDMASHANLPFITQPNLDDFCSNPFSKPHPILLGGSVQDKVAAARLIADAFGRIFIWVQAGENDSIDNALKKPIKKAIELGHVVVFFDNIERIGGINTGSSAKTLQIELERLRNHDILFIASTLNKDLIFPGVLEHFTTQIECLPTIPTEVNQVVPKLLNDNLETQYAIDAILATLNDDFKMPFSSMDEWLDFWLEELINPHNESLHMTSPVAGDTMLHLLTKIPLIHHPETINRIKEVGQYFNTQESILSDLRYVRNNNDETPFFALEKDDPNRLIEIFYPEKMVKLGDELILVDNFLENIKKTPKVAGHFLLLDGPPGTGKTSTVQDHLVSQGYSVDVWEQGSKNDKNVGGIPLRIKTFFDDAKKAAFNSKTLHILFIDEIDKVTPLTKEGPIDSQYHDKGADTTTFQTEITDLKGHQVIVIGATNYPSQIAKPMLQRAATNRIYFPLPDEAQRIKLLNFFFRAKAIKSQSILQLAKVAVAYAPRELLSFVESIKADRVTQEMMVNYFNRYARTLTAAFKDKFRIADLFMPSFEKEDYLVESFSLNDELTEQFNRLKSTASSYANKHTLLFGPPGSGKTTAVKIFAQTSGCVLIAIQADEKSSGNTLSKIFDRAKQLGPTIIFFDEMHNIAQKESKHCGFIQIQMDGIIENNITIIGATNYIERFEEAILSRFISKIKMPKLSAEVLGKPIRKLLLDSIKRYPAPVYVDSALADELINSPAQLSLECDRLDLRQVGGAFSYLMGDLESKNTNAGITYLQLKDVCFSIVRMKIQEGMLARQNGDITNSKYIEQNRLFFFPKKIPQGATLALQCEEGKQYSNNIVLFPSLSYIHGGLYP